MAIVFDSASGTQTSALTSSFTHIVADEPNRILMVGCAQRFGVASGNSVTYSGIGSGLLQDLTFYAAYNSVVQARTEIWYLTNPTAGSGTITTTLNNLAKHAVNSVSYYGVDTVSPFGGSGNSTATSATPTVTLTTTAADSLIFNHIAIRYNSTRTWTATSPNTVRSDFATDGGNASANAHGVANDLVAATIGSYTASGTISASTEHAYQAVELKQYVAPALTYFSRGYVIKPFK